MAFDYSPFNLPICEVFPEIRNKLSTNNTLILNAPPGAGKSTLLPLMLFEESWLKGQKILVLEPRRLAAKSIAIRLASLLGEKVGDTVGYRIRFETKISKSTRIEILTEGILTRILQADNALEGVGLVIFDEFHERNIHADVALALLKETQSILRPDLRILIMSATLNKSELVNLLKAPLVVSEGRQYPIELVYNELKDERFIAEQTAQTVRGALKEQSGDILVFLPGQREIQKCKGILEESTHEVEIHALYGKLSQSEQMLAINPSPTGKRKVVVSSAIAETSLTIQGIKVVVDSGFGRTAYFDPKSGLSGLKTIRIPKDSADQRAGRAGRLGPGVCYRMWSKGQHTQLKPNRTPEIMEADLTALVLEMAFWGISDLNELTWVTLPPKLAVFQAKDLLERLNVLENGKITTHGKEIKKLPCHPRIAHMLLKAKSVGLTALATDIAAILEERDPLPQDIGVDINLRIEALRRYRRTNKKSGAFSRIEKIASQYRTIMHVKCSNEAVNENDTGLLIIHAYPERIAFSQGGTNAHFLLSNGKTAKLNVKDNLSNQTWLAIANLNATNNGGQIFLASPLNSKDIEPFVQEIETHVWNTKWGGVIATKESRIGRIVIKSIPLQNASSEKTILAISNAMVKEGEHLLNFDSSVKQWQNRVETLRALYPNAGWPNVSTRHLLNTNEKWLSPYLIGVKKPEDLKRINLKEVLNSSLDYQQQLDLAKLAPERIGVPSGSSIKLEYQANGSAPILAVRIQEVFGLADTPTINNGLTGVLMHLLSPGYKPVQITKDLRSFWASAYFEVRKELRVRYKKHAWPEDPSNEPAICGTKKQNRK